MITANFITILGCAIVLDVVAIFLLIFGIYTAITDKFMELCAIIIILFLFLSILSGFLFRSVYEEYQNAKPQNQVKILKQKISDAEKALQEYLHEHPEVRENDEQTTFEKEVLIGG